MTPSTIVAVLAADDRFSRPLAATVRSIVATLAADRDLELFLFDMGIAPANKLAVEQAARHPRTTTRWLASVAEDVDALPMTWPGRTGAAYARLHIPSILADYDKVLYLDCDLIVKRSIGDLFDLPIGGHAALAALDASSPYVCSPYGVPYWTRYDRCANDYNFNSGVMIMNLAAWREEDVTGRAIAYLTSDRRHFLADQEAINAVLPGRIGLLDPRWNQQAEHFETVFEVTLPYSADEYEQLLRDPWIVHYTTAAKPWVWGTKHPFVDDWYASLDATPYRGWRPSRRSYVGSRARRAFELAQSELQAIRRPHST